MASEIPEIVLCFSVLAHNSTPLWLLEFCLSIFVVSCSSLSEDSADFRYVPLYMADQVVLRCFFYKNVTLKTNSFSITQLKASWIYLDIAAFQNFRVSLLLPHACEDFDRVFATEKEKKNCKFDFRLNCKQRLTFLQGQISDNRLMSVDAA